LNTLNYLNKFCCVVDLWALFEQGDYFLVSKNFSDFHMIARVLLISIDWKIQNETNYYKFRFFKLNMIYIKVK